MKSVWITSSGCAIRGFLKRKSNAIDLVSLEVSCGLWRYVRSENVWGSTVKILIRFCLLNKFFFVGKKFDTFEFVKTSDLSSNTWKNLHWSKYLKHNTIKIKLTFEYMNKYRDFDFDKRVKYQILIFMNWWQSGFFVSIDTLYLTNNAFILHKHILYQKKTTSKKLIVHAKAQCFRFH